MPAGTITYEESELQIPRGIAMFFEDSANATPPGMDFGEVPSTTVNIASETSDYYSSRSGIAELVRSDVVKTTREMTLECVNMSAKVYEMFLSGATANTSQASGSVNEDMTVVSDRYYQLGYSTSNPTGNRNVSSLSVEADAAAWVAATAYAVGDIVKPTTGTGLHYYRCTVAGTSHASTEPTWPTNGSTVSDGTVTWDDAGTLLMVDGTDYDYDATHGLLHTLSTIGTVDTPITIAYTKAAKTWERTTTGASVSKSGRLRILADNAVGTNRDWLMPSVTLIPEGDLPLIQEGTDYVKVAFRVSINKPANMEAIYVDGRPA